MELKQDNEMERLIKNLIEQCDKKAFLFLTSEQQSELIAYRNALLIATTALPTQPAWFNPGIIKNGL